MTKTGIVIYGKIGTHASYAFRVKSKRTYPYDGEIINVRPCDTPKAKWSRVRIDSVTTDGFYYLSYV